jgi:phosphatidylethanolamine/phosphatidyl-N-methylethanolamine N-methyltransferase
MSSKTSFIGSFFKEMKMVGALAPSSKFLAKKMLKHVDFTQAKLIVEFGPGNGVFTKMILEKMLPDTTLIVYELNDTFFEKLKKDITDPRVILIKGSADSIADYVKTNNLGEVDYIISSLPLANFPKTLIESILKASDIVLKKNGKYIQFQYTLTSRRHLKKKFKDMSLNFALLNLPPAFVYTCTKK